MKTLVHVIESSMPELRENLPPNLQIYHQLILRAESSVFWPGITADINKLRQGCGDRIAPSQQNTPPTPIRYSDYHFQQLCGDFFHYKGHYYLVCVDRYFNWPIVEEARNGANGLIDSLRRTFVTFGIPDEFSSDGGLELSSNQPQRSFVTGECIIGSHRYLSPTVIIGLKLA